jgi:hypothetical protein
MGILQSPVPIPVTNGNFPQFKFAVFSDNLTAVTTAGYLTNSNIASGFPLSNADVVMALYSYNQQTQSGTFGIFTVNIAPATGQITLTTWGNPGDAILPTTANYLAHFVNTTGTISSAAGNVIQPGNISAGLSGTAGTVASFPATASKGSLILAGVANTGNTNTTISNVAMGQASVVSIPDPAAATANFAVAPAALVNNNLIKASGTAGLIADSGIAAASVPTFTSPTIANHLAVFTNTTGNLGEDAATAINGGNIQAGLSGTAGTVASFPSTAARGSLVLAGVANTGNTNTTISNAAMGQASVVSIPDPGASTASFVLNTGTTAMAAGSQLNLAKVNGTEAANAVTASGNAGVITTSSLTTAGGASYAITWTNTHITATSVIALTIQGGTNTVQNITFSCVPGSGTATLTIYNNTAATALNGTIFIGYVVL